MSSLSLEALISVQGLFKKEVSEELTQSFSIAALPDGRLVGHNPDLIIMIGALAEMDRAMSEWADQVAGRSGSKSMSGYSGSTSIDDEIATIEAIMATSLAKYNSPMPNSGKTYRQRYAELMAMRHGGDDNLDD